MRERQNEKHSRLRLILREDKHGKMPEKSDDLDKKMKWDLLIPFPVHFF